jgi:hypothetical protein
MARAPTAKLLHLMCLPLAFAAVLAGVYHCEGASPDKADFWSYKPVVRPAVPQAARASWNRNPIDAFVWAKLREKGLSPAPPDDRRTLIRRVSFDLTGLPPTPREIDAFVDDPDPSAYEKLVDRLLASPRYGERWARHWLDVVRFAESQGFEMNKPRPNAWPYRDYVIRAFNDDKPYNDFVREQLAGDATGAEDATGYLVAGPTDEVKSPDIVLTLQQRADELHDMVSTTGATFLGATVGCARCHDHKFDAISQKDYYRMTAIFAGVQHGERALRLSGAALANAGRLRSELADVEQKLVTLRVLAQPQATAGAQRPGVRVDYNIDRFEPVIAQSVRFTILATANGDEPCIDELEVLTAPEPDVPIWNVALASEGAKAIASGTIAGFAIHKIEHLNDGLTGNDHSWISDKRNTGWVEIRLPRPARIGAVAWGRDRHMLFKDRLATRYQIEIADAAGNRHVVGGSDDRRPYSAASSTDAPDTPEIKTLSAKAQAMEAELRAGQMVYAGTFAQPGPTFRLDRGDPMHKGEAVTPGGVASIAPLLDLPADAPEQQRRIALAKWITDPANPLTARVIVNRLWQHHFGRGIVATPSDFGHMGTPPTHPQLLDWLAAELVRDGWHLKAIQRQIVLSSTYRQSGKSDPAALAQDAQDTLLWRFPPQRLEAEEIRDSILAVSGRLDLAMGGPGFEVFKPDSSYVHIYQVKEEFGPPEWRRMVYENRPRLQTDGIFGGFDCPDGTQIAPRRATSTTPLQALNLLNSRFMLQQADFLAQRLVREAGTDAGAQATLAFRLAFGRAPDAAELYAAGHLIRQQGLPIFCRAVFNANEFLYVD